MLREKQNLPFANYIKAFLLAITASMSMLISNGTYPATQQAKEQLGSRLAVMIWQIRSSFNDIDYPFFLVIVLLFVAFVYLLPKVKKQNIKYGILFAVIASLFILLCDSYADLNSWDKLFGSTTAIFTSCLRGIGISVLCFFVFDLVNRISIEKVEEDLKNKRNIFFKFALVIFVCWIPYFVILSPGALGMDTRDQLAQVTGNIDIAMSYKSIISDPEVTLINNHHPVFHTLLLGAFLKLGELAGSYFFGIELYCICQSIAFCSVLSYCLIKLKQYGLSKSLSRLVLIFFALFPLFPLWSMATFKDIPFAIVFLFLTVLLYDAFKYPEKFNKLKYFALIVAVLLLMLFRNNGFYLIIAFLPFVVIHYRKDKRFLLKIVSVLIIPIVVFKVGYEGWFFNALGIQEGSPREMLSVPFQQTARYIDEYENEITPEEEDAILTVLGGHEMLLHDIAELYNPAISDYVKSTYNKYTQTDDLINYFKVWFAQFTKHPLVYVEAFLNLNYTWFCFDSYRDMYYYNGITDPKIPEYFDGLDNPESLDGERMIVEQAVRTLAGIPLLNCIFEFSFYTWLFVISFIVMLIRKKFKELLACLPLFGNYALSFLGPVGYIRYALPMIISAVFVIFITLSKKKNECYNQKDKITGEENEIWIK